MGSIRLRQRYNLSLGDAIIAATALTYQLQLWTANIKDFQSVEGLNLYNPLEAAQ
ncbi:hypothetical protein KC853_00385 [Candidatus Saccharibacteria bacterium]|nr:hypothetical protein [Candidatus Saccharibacteria bacterium]